MQSPSSMTPENLAKAFAANEFLTPPELAKHIRTDPATIREWCRKNILHAVDTRADGAKRPRWKITQAAWENFARMRAGVAPLKPKRRRDPEADLSEFFGDEF